MESSFYRRYRLVKIPHFGLSLTLAPVGPVKACLLYPMMEALETAEFLSGLLATYWCKWFEEGRTEDVLGAYD